MSGPHTTIVRGLPSGSEAQAAALYWQAFGDKLGKLLGPEERARTFFTATINPSAVLSAIDNDSNLLGIAAVKTGDKGFSDAGLTDLWRHYGFGTLWRVIPLALLERSAPKGVLQMDGICVSADARGKGVGTALLNAVFDTGREAGFRAVRLDVIDRNARAKALYQRMGFVAISEESTGPLRPLLGFSTATRMEKQL